MTDQIAFIGVGNMGNPMADQLVKAGKKVKVYDVSPEMIKKAKDANLDVVDTCLLYTSPSPRDRG